MPGEVLRSYALAVRSEALNADRLCALLRRNETPVIARISNDEVLLDMRTLLDGEDDIVRDALCRLANSREGDRV